MNLNIADPDKVYQNLIALHEGLDDEASAALNCRLIPASLNHVGDEKFIQELFALARAGANEKVAS